MMSSGFANRSTLQSTVERGCTNSMRIETEEGLIKLLNELVALDRSLERAKQDVIQRPDFNVYDAFRIFDVDVVGAISESEFKYALADIGVHVQAEDIDLFFKRFNKRKNGRLEFGEFAAAFDPLDNYYANILC